MNIGIVGTGYVGLVTGCCLSQMGHSITCCDIDDKKIALLKDGVPPILEEGLESLLKKAIQEKNISFTTAIGDLKNCDSIFLCVGTPGREDGSVNMSYVKSAVEQIASFLTEKQIVVIKSTVPIGTHKWALKLLADKLSFTPNIVNNPEFLKEGTAINDFMNPDRIVVGGNNKYCFEQMREVYREFISNATSYLETTNENAEMIKYVSNSFLAMKISFINEISRLCEAVGANVTEVKKGLVLDKRVGPAFLNPGPGYGGSCFPKDVQGLMNIAIDKQLQLPVLRGVDESNELHKSYLVKKVFKRVNKPLKKVALLGVAFKAGTDDVRKSSAFKFTERFCNEHIEVNFYDPEASENFLAECTKNGYTPNIKNSVKEAVTEADAVIVLTEWPEFTSINFKELKPLVSTPYLFDYRNLYKEENIKAAGFEYFNIGNAKN